jgi:predicted O-methyltransferase YrrM
MPNHLNLSSRLLSVAFWDAVLGNSDENETEKRELLKKLKELEQLRIGADYNTGSISAASAWCLYSLVRYFGVTRAIEIGTFIGKSTVSIAAAMDRISANSEVYTCDASNSLSIPKCTNTKVIQYKKKTSTEMLSNLEGVFDFLFLDGRIQNRDIEYLEKLLTNQCLIALDDFEGTEKGVSNLFALRQSNVFQTHFLIYPCQSSTLKELGFSSHSLLAVIIPAQLIKLTAQG